MCINIIIGYIYDLINGVYMTELFIKPGRRLRCQHFTFEDLQHKSRTKDFSHVLEPLNTCGKQTANFKF